MENTLGQKTRSFASLREAQGSEQQRDLDYLLGLFVILLALKEVFMKLFIDGYLIHLPLIRR
jgi:hypothetical protein